jgi:hypothetical protein
MTILKILNTGDITYNAITANLFYFKMIFLITVNNEHICNVAFINAISNVVTCKVFISIVVLLFRANRFLCLLLASFHNLV